MKLLDRRSSFPIFLVLFYNDVQNILRWFSHEIFWFTISVSIVLSFVLSRIFPFFILLPCSQTVELAEYHHQYIKHPTKVYIPLNLLMLFNEERSHLAADQSKNFPQSLTYNYYWIPRLVIVVIWPKCCAAFFLLLFFFFSFECNCSTSAAKR